MSLLNMVGVQCLANSRLQTKSQPLYRLEVEIAPTRWSGE